MRVTARPICISGILVSAILIPFAALFLNCKQKPRPRSLDFSSSNKVSVVLGDPSTEYGTGLQHIYFENDGLTTITELDGIPCRYLKLDSGEFGYFYFTIDPTFKKVPLHHARIEVEYYDLKPGTLTLHYDASETRTNSNPRYTEATPKVLLHGTKAWQIATFYVENGTFKNGQNSGSDFRLCISPPALHVRRVTVIRAAN